MGLLSKLKSFLGLGQKNDDFVPSQKPIEPQESNPFVRDNTRVNQTFENPSEPSFTEKAKDFVEDASEKAGEFIKGTAEEVKEQGSAIWEAVKEKAEDLDQATKPYRDEIKEKIKETTEKVEDFVNKTVEKEKEAEAKDKAKDADGDGIADKPIDWGKSTVEKHGGFFDKAEKWLEKQDAKDAQIISDKQTTSGGAEGTDAEQKNVPTLELPKE